MWQVIIILELRIQQFKTSANLENLFSDTTGFVEAGHKWVVYDDVIL